MRPSATGLLTCAILVLAAGSARAADTAPPEILIREPRVEAGKIVFGARITDPSGIKSATLWIRAAREAEYRSVAMKPAADEGEYTATVPKASLTGARVQYYLEALDEAGNPPARHGNEGRPHVLPIEVDEPDATGDEGGGLRALLIAALVALIVVLVKRLRFRPPAPAVVTRSNVVQPAGPPLSLAHATAEQIREEVFWFRLLAPLEGRDAAYRERALRDLASRSHTHPTLGRRIFPIAKLRERLARVARIDPQELLARAEELERSAGSD